METTRDRIIRANSKPNMLPLKVDSSGAASPRSNSITLEGLGKSYGSTTVLHEINLHVKPGELFTILGPSGSGKTTLLSLIAGMAAPSRGRLLIGDRDVTTLEPAQRGIGVVFQNYALFPNLSVFDNVAFPLSIRRRPRHEIAEKVNEMLERVQLTAVRDRRPSQLSGGQQQRVALARALVFRPSIVLLDEPLGALDRQLRERLQVELKELQRSLGVTMILVTHDQEEALSLSDRLAIIDKGRLQQVAPPNEAYLRPANPFVATFLGMANFVETPDGGQAVVRPERLRINREQDGFGVSGQVRHTVYLGPSIRQHITLDGGGEMVANIPATAPASSISPGERVHASWRAEDAWPCT